MNAHNPTDTVTEGEWAESYLQRYRASWGQVKGYGWDEAVFPPNV